MKLQSTILAGLFLFLTMGFSFGNATIYAKFEGGVATPGDSLFKGRQGWIELGSVNLGIENTVNIGSISAGGGAGKATFKELTIDKAMDSASAGLMQSCVTGQHYETVTIEIVRPGREPGTEQILMKMTMKLVMVQDVSVDYADGADRVDESVILQYGAHEIIVYKYRPSDGSYDSMSKHIWSSVTNSATLDVN